MSLPPIRSRFAVNVVENDAHEVLLLRRSPRARLGPGLWGFPAGHIEENEPPIFCSRRELDEEIGPRHRLELLRTFGPVRDSFYGGVYEVHLYHYRWLSGEVILNHEHTAYAWVGKERYRDYPVMDGIDEDLAYLEVWARACLNADRLPPALAGSPGDA